jgi:PIN domain nuclease of toxin-antitoxin system
MRLLLDTQAFLWFIMGDPRTSHKVRSLIEDKSHEKVLSAVTPWEIAIKVGLKKLVLNEPFDVVIPREINSGGFSWLSIELRHTVVVATLPNHHRDPFDRMLAAQALVEAMPILSVDPALDAYGVTRIW